MIYETIFWLAYLSGIGSYILRAEEYIRPFNYFSFIALATAILAIHIQSQKDDRYKYWQLGKVILLCLTTQWSLLLLYPDSILGSDPWYHHMIVNKIISGEITGVDYYGTLLFQLITGHGSQLFGISIKWAEMLFIGLPYIAGICWLVYRFGTMVRDHKTGLLAALSLSFASMFLFFGIEIVPSSLGMLFALAILHLLIRICQVKSKWNIARYAGISILFIATMYLNALMIIFAILLMGLVWLGLQIYRSATSSPTITTTPILAYVVSCTAITLIFWALNTGQINIMFRFVQSNFLLDPALDGGQWPQALSMLTASSAETFEEMYAGIIAWQNTIPIHEVILKKLGMYLYIGIGIIGCVVAQWPRFRNQYSVAFAIMGIILVMTLTVNASLSRYLFLSRHAMLVQIMLAPVIGLLIASIPWKKSLVTGIAVFVLSLLTILSPYMNTDNRAILPNVSTRLTLTQGEMSGINDLCQAWEGNIGSDWYAGYYIYHTKQGNKDWHVKKNLDISEALFYKDFSKLSTDTLVIIRKEVVEYPVLVLDRAYRFGYDPTIELVQQGYGEIYNNGEIRGFLRQR